MQALIRGSLHCGPNNADSHNISNALLPHMAGSHGRFAFKEFLAVLQATEKESWRWHNVEERCHPHAPEGACYLYENIDGLAVYSKNLAAEPILAASSRCPLP